MTVTEIEDVCESFIQAAKRLKSVGADGIQLHCAHGYLLSAFLSPALNTRTDGYGGTKENRVRLVAEIACEVRKATGPDFLISAKINGDDCCEGGVTPEICGWYVSQLARHIDLFEISCGVSDRAFASRLKRNPSVMRRMLSSPAEAEECIQKVEQQMEGVAYFEGFNISSGRIVHRIAPNANLAVVGGLKAFSMMENAVSEGSFKLVSLARPFIRQPDLVNYLKREGTDVQCIRCGLCSLGSRGVTCYYPAAGDGR